MYYSGLNCFGRKLENVHKATTLINVEKAYPGFLRSWEKLKDRICKGNYFTRKDDHALAVYCGLYVHYISVLGFKDRFEEFENYLYLLIAIQTKIQVAHLSFDEMVIIDSVGGECNDCNESELLELISRINETIRMSWGKTKGRLDNLTIQNNIDKLAILNEKVLEEEQKFLKTIDDLVMGKGDFELKDVLYQLRFAFICYEEALIDMKNTHKELALAERLIVNSPEKCREFAKEIFLEECKVVNNYAVAIFENGTTVTGLEYKEDIETIKEKAKEYLIEVCEADAIETFVEKEFDNDWLMMLARIGYGVANYYLEQKDCYYDIDIEIARENRNRDSKELKIKYILYNGEIVFDLKKKRST